MMCGDAECCFGGSCFDLELNLQSIRRELVMILEDIDATSTCPPAGPPAGPPCPLRPVDARSIPEASANVIHAVAVNTQRHELVERFLKDQDLYADTNPPDMNPPGVQCGGVIGHNQGLKSEESGVQGLGGLSQGHGLQSQGSVTVGGMQNQGSLPKSVSSKMQSHDVPLRASSLGVSPQGEQSQRMPFQGPFSKEVHPLNLVQGPSPYQPSILPERMAHNQHQGLSPHQPPSRLQSQSVYPLQGWPPQQQPSRLQLQGVNPSQRWPPQQQPSILQPQGVNPHQGLPFQQQPSILQPQAVYPRQDLPSQQQSSRLQPQFANPLLFQQQGILPPEQQPSRLQPQAASPPQMRYLQAPSAQMLPRPMWVNMPYAYVRPVHPAALVLEHPVQEFMFLGGFHVPIFRRVEGQESDDDDEYESISEDSDFWSLSKSSYVYSS